MESQLPPPSIQVTREKGSVKIHTFISPDAFLANATHIIESENALVIVDGQFVVPYAQQFRAYADSLKKPIDRVFLSHEHPDHFFGLGAAFRDCAIYALPQTIDFLNTYGEGIRTQLAQGYGDFVTKELALPTHSVSAGTEVIDGVTYQFVPYIHAETEYQLAIQLPELNAMITQDLIYSGAHLYISRDIDPWIESLNALLASPFDLFLAGHGVPCTKDEIQNNITYLQKAKALLARNPTADEFKAQLLDAFPDRTVQAIFAIYLPRLFSTGASLSAV